jgi:GDP-L-fucose synthase
MKKIVVFGANGFIGKNIVEKLGIKYSLLTPGRDEIDLTQELEVDWFFRNNRVDVVINCAVVGGSRKEEYRANMLGENLRMFFNIVRNKNYFGRLIHLGSGAEYDKKGPLVKVKEKDFDKTIPKDEYGFYKYICSKYIENTDNIINLRIFGLYGKYEDYKLRFISNAICRNIFGMSIVINKDVYFDYVYVNDFIKILEYFIINKPKQKFYNIGTGKSVNLLRITDIINKISLFKSKIIVKNKGMNNEYTCDNSLLVKEIGRIEFTSLQDSLREMSKWYKNNKMLLNSDLI